MKSKTDLYQLIKAMSKSEKRYFTLDAQKSGRKSARYLELFQAINDQETYDEATLKTQFTNLHTDKAYLYDAILRSMRDYRSANSYAARIKEMIMDAKYLYERGLYEQSEERILSAKQLSEELGDILSAIELNKEHRRLLKDTKRIGYENELETLIEQKVNFFKNLDQELAYLDIHDRLFIEIRQNPERLGEQQQHDLKTRFELFFDENPEEPQTIQGKLRFLQCMAMLNQLLNNPQEVYLLYSKLVDCWDSSPKYKEEEFYRYILDVSNLIHTVISDSTKINLLPKLLTKLEKEKPVNLHDKKILFQRVISYRLLYTINTGDFAEIDKLILRIEKGLKKYDIPFNSELTIIFNVAFLLFLAEQHLLCQEWANKIIQHKRLSIRQDIQNASRILNLLATLELGDFESTEICIRNTQRYFAKFTTKNSLYINIINFLKKMHLGNLLQNRNSQKQLKEYMTSFKNASERVPLGIDELILYWLESKSARKSISEIIKKELNTVATN